MIYLFNSASNENYIANVLNVFYLPNGSKNSHGYTIGQNVDASLVNSTFLKLKKDVDFIIIYIDRFASGGYQFYPIRRGKIISTRLVENKLKFHVIYSDFICPTINDSFQSLIKSKLSQYNLPALTSKGVADYNDGYYAIDGEDFFQGLQLIDTSKAWSEIVNRLYETKAFIYEQGKKTSVFIKGEFFQDNKPLSVNSKSYEYRLIKGKEYEFSYFYKFPQKKKIDNLTTNIKLN